MPATNTSGVFCPCAVSLGKDQRSAPKQSMINVDTTAIMRTPKELAAVVGGHPFGADTSHSHVVFLRRKPGSAAVARLAAADHSPDRAVLAGPDVYLHYRAGVQGSRLSAARLERLLEVPGTHRNWRTVAALAELAAEA